MADLSNFDPNCVGNPDNNIFGLPFTEDDAKLVIVPVPWEVTVSYGTGTSRAPDAIFKASLQVDLYDTYAVDAWKQGYYMKPLERKKLAKSDYLRNEAELYIDYISKGECVDDNRFICKSLREINEGSVQMNEWVYENTKALIEKGKLVALLGGDHSTPLGFFKAQAEKHGSFGILQIDAHADLREAYEGFKYSHASIMYNALNEVENISKIVQVGVRDFGSDEYEYIQNSNGRVVTFFDADIKERMCEGEAWKTIVNEIVAALPEKVHISFDIDGLDPKLCPGTGTPVAGGFEVAQIIYLFKKVIESGRKLIGFDLVEVGVGETDWNANVGARLLYNMCGMLVKNNA